MRSMLDLIHDAIYPNTRVYHDANGNYRGSSTDVTPFLTLLGWRRYISYSHTGSAGNMTRSLWHRIQ